MIKQINKELDNILNESQWTDKEYDLYCLLEAKLIKYYEKYHKYKLNSHDKAKIIENFTNQKWFFSNPIFNKILNTLYIEEYKSKITDLVNILYVKIKFSDFYIILSFKNENYKVEQKIIIYNDSYKQELINTKQKLDYEVLRQIVKFKDNRLENIEIYRFIKEIILYFDSNYDIKFINE